MFFINALFLLTVLFSSCTHLNSVSTTPIPAMRKNKVRAENYRFIFFFFNFNNNYVDEMVEKLADQCPKGKIEGLLTKQESITYFPIIAHASQVTAEGYCVNSDQPSSK